MFSYPTHFHDVLAIPVESLSVLQEMDSQPYDPSTNLGNDLNGSMHCGGVSVAVIF